MSEPDQASNLEEREIAELRELVNKHYPGLLSDEVLGSGGPPGHPLKAPQTQPTSASSLTHLAARSSWGRADLGG